MLIAARDLDRYNELTVHTEIAARKVVLCTPPVAALTDGSTKWK